MDDTSRALARETTFGAFMCLLSSEEVVGCEPLLAQPVSESLRWGAPRLARRALGEDGRGYGCQGVPMIFQVFPPAKLTPAESFCFTAVPVGAVVFAKSLTCR